MRTVTKSNTHQKTPGSGWLDFRKPIELCFVFLETCPSSIWWLNHVKSPMSEQYVHQIGSLQMKTGVSSCKHSKFFTLTEKSIYNYGLHMFENNFHVRVEFLYLYVRFPERLKLTSHPLKHPIVTDRSLETSLNSPRDCAQPWWYTASFLTATRCFCFATRFRKNRGRNDGKWCNFGKLFPSYCLWFMYFLDVCV